MEKHSDNKKTKKSISIKTVAWILGGFGVSILVMLVVSLYMLSFQFERVQKMTQEYASLKISAMEVQEASDYLTSQARSYVATGNDEFIFNYMEESYTAKTRQNALAYLESKLGKVDPVNDLEKAVDSSVTLMNDEFYAMRLAIVAFDKDYSAEKYQLHPNDKKHVDEIFDYVMTVELSAQDIALSKDEQKNRALGYVYGDDYQRQKSEISGKINSSVKGIDELLEKNVLNSSEQLRAVLVVQQAFIMVLIVFFILAIVFIRVGLTKPIDTAVEKISKREFLESRGLREYRYLVDAYNEARATTINNAEKLTYIAEHDNLTGLYNRAGYDSFYNDLSLDRTIYILVDIDDFKAINDNYGHAAGDKALKRLSNILTNYFPNDYICRLGGDEFAILIFDYSNREVIKQELIRKFNKIEEEAAVEEKGLPSASFSIGVAFGTKSDNTDSLYRKADKAMYEVKGRTKSDYCFYEDIKK